MLELNFHQKLRWLYPLALEENLKRLDKAEKRATASDSLLIDLSHVRFASLGCLVQIVLVVESQLAKGRDTTVALPLTTLRHNEEKFLDSPEGDLGTAEIHASLRERRSVSKYISQVGFLKVLLDDRLANLDGELRVVADYDSSFGLETLENCNAVTADEVRSRLPRSYSHVAPLTWLSHSDRSSLVEFANLLTGIMRRWANLGRTGLLLLDADTLTNVLLEEMTENTVAHSGHSWTLAAAWSADSSFWKRMSDAQFSVYLRGHSLEEQASLKQLAANDAPFVELYFGDCGSGIIPTLEPQYLSQNLPLKFLDRLEEKTAVLAWAFDRWSTSRPTSSTRRGTRGLYRVNRVAEKYSGIVSVHSGSATILFDHMCGSDTGEPSRAKSKVGTFPGTYPRRKLYRRILPAL